MMTDVVVDTSALVAIINNEPETDAFLDVLVLADPVFRSLASLHEAYCVMQRYRSDDGSELLRGLVDRLGVELVPFDLKQQEIARTAYARYGRGSGHRANFNMADCYSYALAKSLDLPLLFKGNDFVHSDILAALIHMT